MAAHLLVAARIVFFGDSHFDRGVRKAMRDRDPSVLLSPTQTLRDTADLVLFNMESPLCDSSLPATVKQYSLRSDPSVAVGLAKAKFTHAILANNHSMDRGVAGLAQTIRALRLAGISPVGAATTGDPCAPVVSGIRGDSVALLALVVLPGMDSSHVCANLERVKGHLSNLKRRQIPSVVSVHWGKEYQPTASHEQRRIAHELVGSGAGAIVGHHAHVVQSDDGSLPSMVESRPVWYGIGNFIFDQWEPWTRTAIAAQIETKAGGVVTWQSVGILRSGPIARPDRFRPRQNQPGER